MSIRLPVVTDFACSHPGCGAIKGFRCTYSGHRHGHPIRRQRLIECLTRRIRLATAQRAAVLDAYRVQLLTSWESRTQVAA